MPIDSVGLGLDDWGNLQGAVLVERLRTVCGKPLDIDGHLERLKHGAEVLGIRFPTTLNSALVHECVQRNRHAHAFEDLSVVVLLTPGKTADRPPGCKPTVILHTVDLHWRALSMWYSQGQSLITAENRNVPGNCWPPGIKSRSRMHYYLADRQAAASEFDYAGAVMLDQAGDVTESSTANLLIVESGRIISPPIDSVLQGLSLARTLRLASQLGIDVAFETIPPSRAQQADEVLLTGTSGCIWPAARFNDRVFERASMGLIYRRLCEAWKSDIGIDYIAQAARCSQSMTE
ncbi:MAG: aminotransferase class IV [Pirellulales bacterium]